jgi:hypothetical protein
MTTILNTSPVAQECFLMRKGLRVFALLGKAAPSGLIPFPREGAGQSWAVTAEYGCLRLELLAGDEEYTGLKLLLPASGDYAYGVSGVSESSELVRAVFGLLPAELEELVAVLGRGGFPVISRSPTAAQCSISGMLIPAGWPHLVLSNSTAYRGVVSVETFVKILVSSLPQGQLGTRFPGLQETIRHMIKLSISRVPGIPCHPEIFNLVPAEKPLMK